MYHGPGATQEPGVKKDDFHLARQLSAQAFKVPVEDLRAPTRFSALAALARQVAMYLAHVVLGMSMTAIGQAFGRHRSTVSHACRLIEEKRDIPQFDTYMSRLELLLKCLTGRPAFVRRRNDKRRSMPARPSSVDSL